MMRIKKTVTYACAVGVTAFFGCGRAPEPVAQQAALSAEAVTPAVSFSVDRAAESTRAELERLPLEERQEIRALRVAEAEQAARRASVDQGGDVMVALAAIRDRMSATPEAQAEYEAAEQARIHRNEGYRVTDEDREHFAHHERERGTSRLMTARAAAAREARREDIDRAARHVDPPESARPMPTVADLREGEVRNAH